LAEEEPDQNEQRAAIGGEERGGAVSGRDCSGGEKKVRKKRSIAGEGRPSRSRWSLLKNQNAQKNVEGPMGKVSNVLKKDLKAPLHLGRARARRQIFLVSKLV